MKIQLMTTTALLTLIMSSNLIASSNFCVSVLELGPLKSSGYHELYCDTNKVEKRVPRPDLKNLIEEVEITNNMELINTEYYSGHVKVFSDTKFIGAEKKVCVVSQLESKIGSISKITTEVDCGQGGQMIFRNQSLKNFLSYAKKEQIKKVHEIKGKLNWYENGIENFSATKRSVAIYSN